MRLFVVLSFLFVGGVAEAGNYHVGHVFVDESGTYTLGEGGIWSDVYGTEYTLSERSKQVWNAKYCRWDTVIVYSYNRYYRPQPVVQIKAKDFYERLADNLSADKEYARRAELLQVFYGGQTYSQQAYGQGYYKQRLDLYGGQYQYKQEQLYAPIDLNVALTQQGLNAEQALRIGPQVNQLFAQTIQQLGDSAGQAQLIRELRQAVVELQRVNKPAATIQQEGNLPPPAVLPQQAPLVGFEQSVRVITERLLPSADPAKHMPKGGGQLTQEELRDFAAGRYEALDAKHRCTECHVKQEVKFRLR